MNTYYFAYARNALYTIAKHLKNPVIAVPSYNCGDEISALKNGGAVLTPYLVNDDLSINVDNVMTLLEQGIQAILFVHYFGIRDKNIAEISKRCQELGVLIIEDCAHCWVDTQPLPTTSFAVYSYRKYIPDIPCGGCLVSKVSMKAQTLEMSSTALAVASGVANAYSSGELVLGRKEDSTLNTLDVFGPRLAEFGGYRLGLHPTIVKQLDKYMKGDGLASIIKQRESTQELLNSVVSDTDSSRIYMRQDKKFRLMSVIVRDASAAYKELIENGLNCSVSFWDKENDIVDYSQQMKRNNTLLKNSILGIYVDRIKDSERALLKEVLRKHVK